MRRAILVFVLIAILAAFPLTIASAEGEHQAVGSCPPPFELHHLMDGHEDGEHMHKHVGVSTDQNGDGFVCVKHVGVDGSIHVHKDNNLPLP